MAKSSKALAKEWPYGKHTDFEREMRVVASEYFKANRLPVQGRVPSSGVRSSIVPTFSH